VVRREVNVGLNGSLPGTLAVGGGADDTRCRVAWDEFVAQTLTGVWADGRFGEVFTAKDSGVMASRQTTQGSFG
jgi:hypothetical protein